MIKFFKRIFRIKRSFYITYFYEPGKGRITGSAKAETFGSLSEGTIRDFEKLIKRDIFEREGINSINSIVILSITELEK